MIAYHGTSSVFTEYKSDYPVDGVHGMSGHYGMWFSESPAIASAFCNKQWCNLYDPDIHHLCEYDLFANVHKVNVELSKPLVVSALEFTYILRSADPDEVKRRRDILIELGFDGIIVKKDTDTLYSDGGRNQKYDEPKPTTVQEYHANQIVAFFPEKQVSTAWG